MRTNVRPTKKALMLKWTFNIQCSCFYIISNDLKIYWIFYLWYLMEQHEYCSISKIRGNDQRTIYILTSVRINKKHWFVYQYQIKKEIIEKTLGSPKQKSTLHSFYIYETKFFFRWFMFILLVIVLLFSLYVSRSVCIPIDIFIVLLVFFFALERKRKSKTLLQQKYIFFFYVT